jgi:hypothetical protein
MNVYVLTNGDLNDYDAPAPGAVFLTEREAWKHISKSLQFLTYENGDVYYIVDYPYMYEMPVGVDINMNDVRVVEIPTWAKLSDEIGRHWQP